MDPKKKKRDRQIKIARAPGRKGPRAENADLSQEGEICAARVGPYRRGGQQEKRDKGEARTSLRSMKDLITKNWRLGFIKTISRWGEERGKQKGGGVPTLESLGKFIIEGRRSLDRKKILRKKRQWCN